jgi:misacylated tRNA(Ala) deacylase
LSDNEIKIIEENVNSVIQADLPVVEEFLDRNTAQEQYNLGKLPDEAGDRIRIVKIGDYDACPCSGLHVRSTSEIGIFKLISQSFENGILRLRFKLE